ncbi:Mitochondrial/chloroplast ribosomal protein 36a [Ceraceosorus bombacis]|uniref:Large ribosomal subunit protein mL43 n=1 Tax=Ceraceosorus bombacis TaxID=401625 RepID=A0A0P1BTQ1_9BASI|nr:Mitochondrial/chloroplast ribosomal protein 36a [Ceraceosorus bombacis]
MASPLRRATGIGARARASAHATPVGSFVLPLRKLVLDYCPHGISSEPLRQWMRDGNVERWARDRPAVEVVVRERPGRHPVGRGEYPQNREKVVPLQKHAYEELEGRLQMLADASGAKRDLKWKRNTVISGRVGSEEGDAVRGMWSQLHADGREI